MVGPEGVWHTGAVVDVPAHIADQLVAGRYAEFDTTMIAATAASVETASLTPPPGAIVRRGRGRHRLV